MPVIVCSHYNPPKYGIIDRFNVLPKYYMFKYIISHNNKLQETLNTTLNVNYIWYNSETDSIEIWGDSKSDVEKCREVIQNYIEFKCWKYIIHE